MALSANEMPGSSYQKRNVVDLDEGTTLPRIVSITGVVLIIAGIVFLLATSLDGAGARSSSTVSPVMHKSVTEPARRAVSARMPTFEGSVPTDDIGPTTFRIGSDVLAIQAGVFELLSR